MRLISLVPYSRFDRLHPGLGSRSVPLVHLSNSPGIFCYISEPQHLVTIVDMRHESVRLAAWLSAPSSLCLHYLVLYIAANLQLWVETHMALISTHTGEGNC